MRVLRSWHKTATVLPRGARYFILWLTCGHSGGIAVPGQAVVTRKCAHCGGFKHIERVEPRDE